MENVQDRLMEQFQNMDRAYEKYARSQGLNYISLTVLEELYELGDGCTQKQVSEDTHYPKQSINLVIKAFLNDGLLVLRELPENRKNKGITLTEKGRQLCKDVVEPLLQQEAHVMAQMGEANSRELNRLLELYGKTYCHCLGQICHPRQADLGAPQV